MSGHLFIGGSTLVAVMALLAASGADQPPERPGGRLVLGLHPPERVAVVDVRSGRTVSRRLPGGTLCHGEIAVVGGQLIAAGTVRGGGGAVSMDPALRGRPKAVGPAELFIPSATPGRLWLAAIRDGRRAGFRSLREVTVTGRTTFVARHRPRVKWPNFLGALEDGLVLEGGGRLQVWDPRRGKVLRTMPNGYVLAARGRHVAWCRGRCARLHVTGPRADLTFSLPGHGAMHGAFSPDGSRFAVSMDGGGIALVDLAEGSVGSVVGARAGPSGALAWAPSGRWLFFAGRRGRLIAYRPEGARSVVLPGPVHGHVLSLAAG